MARAPVQDRSKARVERVLTTAGAMLSDEAQPITARALAARSGVSLGTIYQFFADMDAVRAAVETRAETLLVEILEVKLPSTLARDPAAFFAALIATVEGLKDCYPELGCIMREKPPGSFAESLAIHLRGVVLTHIRTAFRTAWADHDRAELDRVLDMATTALLAVLPGLPSHGEPGREAYLADLHCLAAGLVTRRLNPGAG